jgi:polysaccharide export outer membrane protein
MRPFSLMMLSIFLSWGCAAAPPVPADSAISRVQAKSQKQRFQEQLLGQMGQVSLTGYQDYTVGPEDLLEITFFGNEDLGREVRVNGRGEVSLPLVGPVKIADLTPKEIEDRLVQLYQEGRFIRHPQITVFVKDYRHQRVMVTGAVVQPGAYEMIGPRTLLEMLGKAGGLKENAGDMVYVIRRQSAAALAQVKAEQMQPFSPGSETIVIDLRRLLLEGALNFNLPIQNGDVVHVPHAQHAYVLGSVKKPGAVAVKENLTVTQALAMAEGLDPLLASYRVSVIRFNEQGERVVIPVNLGEVTAGNAPDPAVKANDVIFAQESGFRRLLVDIRMLLPVGVGASLPLIP